MLLIGIETAISYPRVNHGEEGPEDSSSAVSEPYRTNIYDLNNQRGTNEQSCFHVGNKSSSPEWAGSCAQWGPSHWGSGSAPPLVMYPQSITSDGRYSCTSGEACHLGSSPPSLPAPSPSCSQPTTTPSGCDQRPK